MRQLTATFNNLPLTVYYITDKKEAIKVLEKLDGEKTIVVDIETSKHEKFLENEKAGLDVWLSNIRLLQIKGKKEHCFVFDLLNIDFKIFHKFLMTRKLFAWNAVFELSHFKFNGCDAKHIRCGMVLYELVQRATILENKKSPPIGKKLSDASYKILNIELPKDLQKSDWNNPKLSTEQIIYAATDVFCTWKIIEKILPEANKFKLKTIYNIITKLQSVIVDMQTNGMPFDRWKHREIVEGWERDLVVKAEICKEHFGDILLTSPKQLSDWAKKFLNVNELKIFTKTATGGLSFNAKKLNRFKGNKAIDSYKEFKKVQSNLSKFGDSISNVVNPITKRLHTSLWLTGTATGRLSSSGPNLQNIPRDENFRNLFVAPKGKLLICRDYNQIELRTAGELSKDPVIKQAYIDGKDLHTIFACKIYGKAFNDITKLERQTAKNANFGLLYGMGATAFQFYCECVDIIITLREAEKIKSAFYQMYPTYIMWCEAVREFAKKTNFVKTKYGRLRKLHPDNTYTRAPNTIVQGTAFEILALAMLDFYEKKLPVEMITTVHDEIMLMADEKYAEKADKELAASMEYGYTKIFPDAKFLKVSDGGVGRTWVEAKKGV